MASSTDSPTVSLAESEHGTITVSWTIEELAEATGVPPRTIRYYQAEKLLPKPDRDRSDGRVARYGDDHIERLRLIGELRDRGLKLPAIRTLLNEGDATTRVAEWLGLDSKLQGAWGTDQPLLVNRARLSELLSNTPVGTQGDFEDARLILRQGAESWLLPSPTLLDLCIRLVREGIRIDLVTEAGAIIESHLRAAADELIDLFVAGRKEGLAEGMDPLSAVNSLRPAASEAAGAIFALQLERAIRALLNDPKRLA